MELTPEQRKGQHGGSPDTMRVKGTPEQGGSVVINAADFDPKVHEKFDEPQAQQQEQASDKAKSKK